LLASEEGLLLLAFSYLVN